MRKQVCMREGEIERDESIDCRLTFRVSIARLIVDAEKQESNQKTILEMRITKTLGHIESALLHAVQCTPKCKIILGKYCKHLYPSCSLFLN